MHFEKNLFNEPSDEKLCCFKNELIYLVKSFLAVMIR